MNLEVQQNSSYTLLLVTLTTMTANSLVCNQTCSNDAHTCVQNIKTVECQLERTLTKLAVTEAKIDMFNTLIRLGLATNDVKNFVVKQISHKKAGDKPDFKVQKIAMKSKLRDACCFAKKLRQERDVLRRRLGRKYCDRKAAGRRILESLLDGYRSRKQDEIGVARNKVESIKNKEKVDKLIKNAPEGTEPQWSKLH